MRYLSSLPTVLEEPIDLFGLRVQVNIIETRPGGKTRDCGHLGRGHREETVLMIDTVKWSITAICNNNYVWIKPFIFSCISRCSYRSHTMVTVWWYTSAKKSNTLLSTCESRETRWKGKAQFTYCANQWVQKTSTHTGSDVSDWQDEPSRHTLLVCLMRERQVSFRHADWEIAETLMVEEVYEMY